MTASFYEIALSFQDCVLISPVAQHLKYVLIDHNARVPKIKNVLAVVLIDHMLPPQLPDPPPWHLVISAGSFGSVERFQ